MKQIPGRTALPALALALGATACAPGGQPAAAPGPGPYPIRVGETVTGTTQEGDATALGRGPFRTYRFQAAEGQRLIATTESEDFDTYLTAGRLIGGLMDEVRSDDDGGEGTNSRVFFVAPATGEYLLVVQGYGEEEFGAFTASLAEAPAATTGAPLAVVDGQSVDAALAESDNLEEEDGGFYDLYTFAATRGQRVTVAMDADELDSYLELGRMDGGEFQAIASDDDGGDGLNARLTAMIPADGDYVVRASSFDDATGAYRLTFGVRTPAAPTPRPVSSGDAVSGALDHDDAMLETDGSFYDLWTYRGHAGEEVVVDMMSDEFDTYVAVGRMVNGDFEELATMDDGGEGTNSHLEMTLPADGEYVIRANSFSAGSTGAYTLRITSSRDR